MKIIDLLRSGHSRIRRKVWADPHAYLRFNLYLGTQEQCVMGPWARLYERGTQQLLGFPTPQEQLVAGMNLTKDSTDDWEAYLGPLDPEDPGFVE